MYLRTYQSIVDFMKRKKPTISAITKTIIVLFDYINIIRIISPINVYR